MGRSWDFYDEIAEIYDSQYEEPYWKLYHSVTEKLIERALKKHVKEKEGMNVLDLGGGTGYWMEFYNYYGYNVYLVEPSEKMADISRMKAEVLKEENYLNIEIVRGIAESIPYGEEKFDIVNAQGDVLSYCMNIDEAMAEIKRTLKKGGLLIASVDSLYAFFNDAVCTGETERYYEIKKERVSEIGDSEHSGIKFKTRLFDCEYVEKIAIQHGFEVIEICGKIVFGPYEENAIVKKFEEIEKIEIENCEKKEFLGKSEHIHFILKKI